MIDKYYVFTDGSCINNGKKNSIGSIGIFFNDDDPDNFCQSVFRKDQDKQDEHVILDDENDDHKITNQTMELLACIQAIGILNKKTHDGLKAKCIHIYTDSSYVINSVTRWHKEWNKNGWKNIKGKDIENKSLIQTLIKLKNDTETKDKCIIIFKHVNAHQPEPEIKDNDAYVIWKGNHMADELATKTSKQYQKELQDKEKLDVKEKALQKEQELKEKALKKEQEIKQKTLIKEQKLKEKESKIKAKKQKIVQDIIQEINEDTEKIKSTNKDTPKILNV